MGSFFNSQLYSFFIRIQVNGKRFITEKEFLNTLNKVGILKFPISESVIKKIKKEQGVTIKPGAFIKIGFLNLSKYVSRQNQELLKGALFSVMGCRLTYKDKNNARSGGATLDIRIVNHRVLLTINWLSALDDLSNEIKNESNYDLSIDLNLFDWYREHLSVLEDRGYIYRLNPRFELTPRFAHNGITYYDSLSNNYGHSCCKWLPILLCHGNFRPELSISREGVRSLPLEMDSEINLALRKAFYKFDTDFEIGKNIDENLIDFILMQRNEFLPSSVTPDEIYELSNFDTKNGWDEIFSLPKYFIVDILSPRTLPGIIYGAMIQKYWQWKLVKETDEHYKLVEGTTAIENNKIISVCL